MSWPHRLPDNELIRNKFNDFFINIGPTLAKLIPHVNKSPFSYLGSRLTESIYLAPGSENEIGQLIKSLQVFLDLCLARVGRFGRGDPLSATGCEVLAGAGLT